MVDAVVIPDAQVEVGSPTEHLAAAGRYIAEKKPTHIICLGDFGDFPSLSKYNSLKEVEGLRYIDDCEAAVSAMDVLLEPIRAEQAKLKENHRQRYSPEMIFITGNHDCKVRVDRFVNSNPQFEGAIRTIDQDFEDRGWKIIPYLEIYNLEGISVSHWIANPHSLMGSPLGGQTTTMLKNAGHSFIMGHQQRLGIDRAYLSNGEVHLGIVAGAFYMHEMTYQSPQAQNCWKGMLHLENVKNGNADVIELSIDKLLKGWG